MKFSQFLILFSLFALVACGKGETGGSSESVSAPLVQDLGPGEYSIPCFFNKPASQGIGMNIYTKADMTLEADGTGSNNFELYDDVGCTNMVASGTVAILSYENIKVGEVQVIKMQQHDGSSVQDIWIPYKSVGARIYLDVDFTDGESGPYLIEPTTLELASFEADAASEGVLLQVH